MMATWPALREVCKKLKLGQNIVENAKKINADTHHEFLLQLFTKELEERDIKRRNAYIKAAKFDIEKTFEKYTFEDIKFPKNLNPDDLKNVTFIPKQENLILYGNVGAGKTHLAIAMGLAACDLGYKTRFWRTPMLVNALTEAKSQGTLSRFMMQLEKLDLLICDEWGYVPIDSNGAKLLFQIVSQCYERKSLIITTNLEFARWNDIFADSKITAALLDRIIHHSHLLDFTNRDSRRLKEALLKQFPASSKQKETKTLGALPPIPPAGDSPPAPPSSLAARQRGTG
jgi:DNA replication protein DnaC